MLKFWSVVIVILLAGCDGSPKVANRTPAERAARAEEKLSVPPVPRTYAVGDNQLVVVDVPVAGFAYLVANGSPWWGLCCLLVAVTMDCPLKEKP
jgi:hypothetical protein